MRFDLSPGVRVDCNNVNGDIRVVFRNHVFHGENNVPKYRKQIAQPLRKRRSVREIAQKGRSPLLIGSSVEHATIDYYSTSFK